MSTEPGTAATLIAESSPSQLEASARQTELATSPQLSVAIASSDPIGCSTLRHMLLQTGLVSEIHEWASAKSVELRHSQDVPEVVFLDISGSGQSEFAFAQQLGRLRPSVHIVACSAKKESNPEFLLHAMRSGVRDFLQKPYDRVEVSSAGNERARGCACRLRCRMRKRTRTRGRRGACIRTVAPARVLLVWPTRRARRDRSPGVSG